MIFIKEITTNASILIVVLKNHAEKRPSKIDNERRTVSLAIKAKH